MLLAVHFQATTFFMDDEQLSLDALDLVMSRKALNSLHQEL